MTEPAPAIGIDLGSTYSRVAVMRHGMVEIIANDQGNYATPSYVAFDGHQCLVGDAAKDDNTLDPKHIVFDAKRLIGRKFNDSAIQSCINYWPFTVKNVDTNPRVKVVFKSEEKLLSPEEISGMVLGKMKETAERYLNQKVVNAVVSVPAYFNDAQRKATATAGKLAGLNVLQIINEPIAAATAFTFVNRQYADNDLNILVFDLGGESFNVSIVKTNRGRITVNATGTDHPLGGKQFDRRLVNFCVLDFKKKHNNRNLEDNQRAMRRLRSACEHAKHILSTAIETKITIDALMDGIDYSVIMTREHFEVLNAKAFTILDQLMQSTLQDAQLTKLDIHKIILVGGSARTPKIRELLKDFFGDTKIDKSIKPDEAIAYGAAIQAAALNGIKTKHIFGHFLQDVTPFSLGIGIKGSATMTVIIPRNTQIPVEVTKTGLTTSVDNQISMAFRIFRGECQFAYENFFLGEFRLTGFPIGQQGGPTIDVTFEINASGTLIVTARDQGSGTTNGITIERVIGPLNNEQVEKMIEHAKNSLQEDLERKNGQARDALEAECNGIQNMVCEHLDEISEGERVRLFKECMDVLAWITQYPNEEEMLYENRRKEIKNFSQSIFQQFIPNFNAN